jgi:hypothetical protein
MSGWTADGSERDRTLLYFLFVFVRTSGTSTCGTSIGVVLRVDPPRALTCAGATTGVNERAVPLARREVS